MGRKRTGAVRESANDLDQLAHRFRGTNLQARISLLKALKEQPDAKTEVLMGLVGHSERTIRRWWHAYRAGGIEALLSTSSMVTEAEVHYDVTKSDPLGNRLIEFLNCLPTACDIHSWSSAVERGLTAMLPGASNLSLKITTVPVDEESSAPTKCDSAVVPVVGNDNVVGILCFDASESDKMLCLSIINELQPFLVFLLADAQARANVEKIESGIHIDPLLTSQLAQLLTPREQDVLLHKLVGHTYEHTANELSISIETVHKCVKSIYRKTDTSSIARLFTRYFGGGIGGQPVSD